MNPGLHLAALIASATLAGCHADPVRAGDKTAPRLASPTRNAKGLPMVPMSTKILADKLHAVDQEKVDEIAAALVGEIRADAGLLVRAALGAEPQASQATEAVLSVDDLAIVALLEVPAPDDPDDKEWLMRMAAGSETRLRRKVIARLDSMLSDAASLPSRQRVCDTAYTLLGRVVLWGQTEALQSPAAFLKSPEPARDQRIARASESETWSGLRTAIDLADFAWAHRGETAASPEEPMDARGLLERFTRPDDGNSGRLSDALAARERQPARAAVEVYLGGDPETSTKAERLLTGLQDLAILALVEREAVKPVHREWMLRTAVEAESALRHAVLAALESVLPDKRPLSSTPPRGAEHVPPRRRVCDAAYLQIHTIVHLGESLDAARESEDRLLFGTDEERDAIIQAALKSRAW
jgi:hypothetical protein